MPAYYYIFWTILISILTISIFLFIEMV